MSLLFKSVLVMSMVVYEIESRIRVIEKHIIPDIHKRYENGENKKRNGPA